MRFQTAVWRLDGLEDKIEKWLICVDQHFSGASFRGDYDQLDLGFGEEPLVAPAEGQAPAEPQVLVSRRAIPTNLLVIHLLIRFHFCSSFFYTRKERVMLPRQHP